MLILASQSPRRKEILDRYFSNYKIIPSSIEEIIDVYKSPIINSMSIAYEKALMVAKENKNDLILAADTIVVCENEILGKPKSELDAFGMLKKLSNEEHKVITAYALLDFSNNIKIIDYEITKVKFRQLAEDEIKKYIQTKEPIDKAGSYAIQGEASKFVEYIDGDYENIVGLPINAILEHIKLINNIKE